MFGVQSSQPTVDIRSQRLRAGFAAGRFALAASAFSLARNFAIR